MGTRSNILTINVLCKNKKNIKNNLLKYFNFYNLRKICILHGHVFVMINSSIDKLINTEDQINGVFDVNSR